AWPATPHVQPRWPLRFTCWLCATLSLEMGLSPPWMIAGLAADRLDGVTQRIEVQPRPGEAQLLQELRRLLGDGVVAVLFRPPHTASRHERRTDRLWLRLGLLRLGLGLVGGGGCGRMSHVDSFRGCPVSSRVSTVRCAAPAR